MLRNRLILIVMIISSGVFVTLVGGTITYTLFFLSVSLPIIAFFYLTYVYIRFRIYQLIEHKSVVKGETIPYRFILSDEDFVSYTDVNVNFYSDLSSVSGLDSSKSYHLLPDEKIERDGSVMCNYRGEYKVGINQVIIRDFLNIFKFTYKCPSPIYVRVFPRVPVLSSLSIAPPEEDDKNHFSIRNSHDVPDASVREYAAGDSLRTIHWKASARTGKLQTRNYYEESKPALSIFLDLTSPCEDTVRRIMITDTVIECALAMTNYFVSHETRCRLIADMSGVKVKNLFSKTDFDGFYQFCTDVPFRSHIEFNELINTGMQALKDTGYCFLITCNADYMLASACLNALEAGNKITILLISEEYQSIPSYFDNRILFKQITIHEDVANVLSSK